MQNKTEQQRGNECIQVDGSGRGGFLRAKTAPVIYEHPIRSTICPPHGKTFTDKTPY